MRGVIEAYRDAIQKKRLNLKPLFQDFDTTRCGHVTKSQFVRVLNQLGIFAIDDVLNTLLKKYMDKGNVDEVNYFDFCNDVDSPEDMFGVGRDFNHSTAYFPKMQPRKVNIEITNDDPEDLDDVIAKIRKMCKEQRIRVGEFFSDFDKLRSGFITISQLRIGLNMAKIVLSKVEFDHIVAGFVSEQKENHIKWREFVDTIDEVFTKKGLEKDSTISLEGVRTETKYRRQGPTQA
jgi:Ca2+-binding EF-hand superfamily protein